jgi:hypothetical protein
LTEPGRRASDTTVVLVAVAVIAAVVIFAWVTDVFQPLRESVAFGPVVIIGLITITAAVLWRAFRSAR